MSPGIQLYANGKVTKDGADLYVPGSATFEAFHRDLSTPNVLLFGRRGTGKSWAVRWHLHRLALMFENFKYMVCRNDKPQLQRTHLAFVDSEMHTLGGDYAKVAGQADYPNGSIGLYAGFEKEADALKVLGMDLDLLVIEEITTMDWEVVTELASTLRTTKASGRTPQLIAPTNPFGPHALPVKRHWIDQDISQEEEPGYDPLEWLAVPTTAQDNPALDFSSYDKRLGPLQAAKRKAWLFGEWSTNQGAFFEDFKTDRHVISRLPEVNGRSIFRNLSVSVYRAIDWGFSDDPCVCLWIAVMPNGRAIVVKEMTWKRTPAAEVAQEIIGHSREMQIVETFADPTMWNGQRHGAQSVADLFELHGVPLTPSVNDRRLYSVHEYLTTEIASIPRIQFWAEGCPTLIATIPQQRPNKNKLEYMADSGTDHHTLALSYFTSGGVNGHEPFIEKPIPHWQRLQQQLEGPRVLGMESVKR